MINILINVIIKGTRVQFIIQEKFTMKGNILYYLFTRILNYKTCDKLKL